MEVDGGYRCTGTFDYVSGCDSATYLTFGFALDDDLTAGELATDVITLIPFDEVEIVHNWDVLGLRGTGSNRVIVDDVFVPSHMTIHSFFDLQAPPFPGRTVHDNPIYRRGSLAGLVFAETCSVAIGTARGVLDLFEESIRTRKTTVLPLTPMTEHAQYPRFYGEALQGIEVAEAALLQTNADYMAEARRADEEDRDFDPDLDRRLQLRMQLCAKMAYDAVLLMMRVNGSAGMRTGAMWQRYLRDMNVLMTHNTGAAGARLRLLRPPALRAHAPWRRGARAAGPVIPRAILVLTSTMATEPDTRAEACAYVVGDDGLSRWSDSHADAWIGLLETHRRLTRALDAELEAAYGLSLSALEILGRLAASPERRLRLSVIAEETGLSLSRVSRIVDVLERRELVTRKPCPSDARAVNAHLTTAGLDLAREAQAAHHAAVQERFFDHLGPEEIAVLSKVFSRFAPRAAAACDANARDPA